MFRYTTKLRAHFEFWQVCDGPVRPPVVAAPRCGCGIRRVGLQLFGELEAAQLLRHTGLVIRVVLGLGPGFKPPRDVGGREEDAAMPLLAGPRDRILENLVDVLEVRRVSIERGDLESLVVQEVHPLSVDDVTLTLWGVPWSGGCSNLGVDIGGEARRPMVDSGGALASSRPHGVA